MVNRIGGAIELIGLRAVILDIRQYGNSGRQIEATNKAIGKATEEAAAKATLSAQATTKAMQTQLASAAIAQRATLSARQYAAAQSAVVAADNAVAAAEAKLNAERRLAAQPRPQDPTSGRFLSQAAVGQRVSGAEAGLLAAQGQRDLATASLNRNKITAIEWGKAQTQAAGEAKKAAELQKAASAVSIAASEKLGASQEKQALLAKNRAKLVTTTAAVAGALTLGAVGVGSVAAASKYQDTLSKINILTNTTDEDTAKLGKQILEMTKSFPQSPEELGSAAYFILSSGIQDAATATNILTASAKEATIGQGSVIDSAKALTSVIVAYGQKNITAAQASDILVQSAKEGRAEFTDFAGAIGKTLPIAAAAGVEFDQVAAAMAVLTNGGLSAEEASTGLRAILQDLTKSSPQAEEALASIGKTSAQLRTEIKDKGLVATMLSLIDAFKGNLAAIEPIIPNIRGLVAASSAFISQGGTVEGVLKRIGNASGVTDAGFAKMSKNFSFQSALLKNQLNVALIQIGTAVLPTVTAAVKDLITWIDKNQEGIKKFTEQGLRVAIAVLKDFASGIGAILKIIDLLPADSQAAAIAVAALGVAFAWALPGGPILKGLQLMILALGALSREGGPGDKTAKKLNDFLGLGHDSGAGVLPNDVRIQVNKQGSVEKAIKAIFGGNEFGDEIAKKMIAGFKANGGDPTKGVEEFDRVLKKVNGTAEEGTKTDLDAIKANTDAIESTKALEKEMQKLAQEFKTTSEAAGQVESFTEKLKLFGNINKEFADKLGLSAIGAGNVQAADAIARAYDRTANRGFEFAKTLATVAGAFSSTGNVAQQIVQGLARAALEASQSALNSILSKPTREVANLGIPLARSQQREAELNRSINPQIEALNRQLKSLDRSSRDLDRQQKSQEKQRKLAEESRKAGQQRQNRILEDQLDAQKLANLIARHAFERQQEQMNDLIAANKKAQSDLQTNFLKSNEDFQNQINKAIGAGSTNQALSLVEQQRAATRNFRGQFAGLQGQGQNLTAQQEAQQRSEAERQRQQEEAAAALDAQQKVIKRQQEDADALAEHSNTVNDNTDAIDAQKQSIDDQKQAIQDQIDSLTAQKDAQSQQTARIQEQIAVYEAQTAVLKAQAVAADQTLLTQQEQARMAQSLIEQIRFESQVVRDLSKATGDFIPDVTEANRQFVLLKDATRVLADEGFRRNLIDGGINPAVERLRALALASDEAGKAARTEGQALNGLGQNIGNVITDIRNRIREIATPHVGSPFSFDVGGITPASGGPFAAILHPNEVVLPLSNPGRSRELMASLPSGLFASSRGGTSIGSIFGDMNVQGATLDDMRSAAIRAVNDAFSQAAGVAARGGSNISLGSGGSENGIGASSSGGGGGGSVSASVGGGGGTSGVGASWGGGGGTSGVGARVR